MPAAPDGFRFVPDFLAAREQDALLGRLRALSYTHDVFRGQRLKRASAYFGFTYAAVGRRLSAAEPIPDFLLALLRKARPYGPAEFGFNQAVATRYAPGSGIGWHADAPGFGDCVLGVSLGASARFQLRPNGTTAVSYEVEAVPGSLYLMCGPARWAWQHRVVPVRAERYSVTFRHVPAGATHRAATRGI